MDDLAPGDVGEDKPRLLYTAASTAMLWLVSPCVERHSGHKEQAPAVGSVCGVADDV